MNNSINYLFIQGTFSRSPLFVRHEINMKSSIFSRLFCKPFYNTANLKCQACLFSHILQQVLLIDNIIYSRYNAVSNQNVEFHKCLFSDVVSQSSCGGALYCTDCRLSIISCKFQNCRSDSQAGGFALIRNNLVMKSTCFYSCSCVKTNENGGNAFLCSNVNISISQSSAFYTSPVKSISGDSVFDVSQNISNVNSWNSSFCNGNLGSSGGSFRSVIEGTKYIYGCVYNCSDHNSFEGWGSRIVVEKSNFLYNMRNDYCFMYGNSNLNMLLKECCFYQNKRELLSSYQSFSFENCISDYGYKGIATTASIVYINMPSLELCIQEILVNQICTIKTHVIPWNPTILSFMILYD